MYKEGRPPEISARSPTRKTGMSKIRTIAVVMPIAAKGAGKLFIIFGVNQIVNIVNPTRDRVIINSDPFIQTVFPLPFDI